MLHVPKREADSLMDDGMLDSCEKSKSMLHLLCSMFQRKIASLIDEFYFLMAQGIPRGQRRHQTLNSSFLILNFHSVFFRVDWEIRYDLKAFALFFHAMLPKVIIGGVEDVVHRNVICDDPTIFGQFFLELPLGPT